MPIGAIHYSGRQSRHEKCAHLSPSCPEVPCCRLLRGYPRRLQQPRPGRRLRSPKLVLDRRGRKIARIEGPQSGDPNPPGLYAQRAGHVGDHRMQYRCARRAREGLRQLRASASPTTVVAIAVAPSVSRSRGRSGSNKAVVYSLLLSRHSRMLLTSSPSCTPQNLTHHPHLHCVVPGCGVSADGGPTCRRRNPPGERSAAPALDSTAPALSTTSSTANSGERKCDPTSPDRRRKWAKHPGLC